MNVKLQRCLYVENCVTTLKSERTSPAEVKNARAKLQMHTSWYCWKAVETSCALAIRALEMRSAPKRFEQTVGVESQEIFFVQRHSFVELTTGLQLHVLQWDRSDTSMPVEALGRDNHRSGNTE